MSGGEQGNCAGCCPAPLFPLTQGRGKSARGAPSCPYMVLPSLTATRNESVNDRGMAGTQAIPMLRSSKGMKPGVLTPVIGTPQYFRPEGAREEGIIASANTNLACHTIFSTKMRGDLLGLGLYQRNNLRQKGKASKDTYRTKFTSPLQGVFLLSIVHGVKTPCFMPLLLCSI